MLALDHCIFSLQTAGGISKWWLRHTQQMMQWYSGRVLHIGPTAHRNQHLLEERSSVPAPSGELSPLWPIVPVRLPRGAQVFHSSYYRTCRAAPGVRTVFTFHDECFLTEKSLSGRVKRACVIRCLRRADVVHCVSKFSRSQLLSHCPWLGADRVRVVYHGIDAPTRVQRPGASRAIRPPFALFVGRRQGYKNGLLALEALRLVPRLSLVLVGGEAPSKDELNHMKAEPLRLRVHHLTSTSSAELNWLYKNAAVLWYPSSREGFGLPVIEAAASGCPVLGASGHSVEEVGRGWPILTDKPNAAWLAEQTERLLVDVKWSTALRSAGPKLAANYTWSRYAEGMAEIYRQVGLEQ